jgi:vacuolar-type H+-ATPase subunit I/STV1
LETTKGKISTLNEEKDKLLNNKEKIDVSISSMNPSKLQDEIDLLTVKGKGLKSSMQELEKRIEEMGVIQFDEDRHYELTKEISKLTSDKAVKEAEINRLKRVVQDLIAGGVCKSCNRKLDDVDNTEHINKHNLEIEELTGDLSVLSKKVDKLSEELKGLNEIKIKIDVKNKLELDKDRSEVEIGSLRNQVVAKMNDLKKYNLNLEAIEHNKRIDISVSKVKTDLTVEEHGFK